MGTAWRFWWSATRGHRIRFWRSDFLRWRLETFSGQKAESIRARDFFRFAWRERRQVGKFLRWTAEMEELGQPNR
jgi:hypothetical protein